MSEIEQAWERAVKTIPIVRGRRKVKVAGADGTVREVDAADVLASLIEREGLETVVREGVLPIEIQRRRASGLPDLCANCGSPLGMSARAREKRGNCPDRWKCRRCARTPEQRSAGARKRSAAMTPEQRSAAARKANASRTPEQRRAVAAMCHNAMTPEQRSARSRKSVASVTPERRQKAIAAMTPEQRSERSRKANASRTPEQRRAAGHKARASMTPEQKSEAGRKNWATRRAKKRSRP